MRAARLAAVLVLLLPTVIFGGGGAAAQAQTSLVSNKSLSDGSVAAAVGNGFETSQGFRTGSSNRYVIHSVEFVHGDVSGRTFDVSVWANDANGHPLTRVTGNFTRPADEDFVFGSTVVFTAPAGTVLNGSRGYSFVFSHPAGHPTRQVKLHYTRSDHEDSASAAGWSIDNRFLSGASGRGWYPNLTGDNAFRMSVNGEAIDYLVSNIDQSSTLVNSGVSMNSGHTDKIGQAFTTGDSLGGYVLGGVRVKRFGFSKASFSASVWSTNSRSHPASRLFDLGRPNSFAAQTLMFTAPADTTLERNTTYAVVLSSNSIWPAVAATSSGGEHAWSAGGWSIADSYLLQRSPGQNRWSHGYSGHQRTVMRMAVVGTAVVSAPGVPVGLEADGRESVIRLSWDAPVDDGGAPVSGYRVEASVDGDVWTDLAADRAYTDYTHSGLSTGSTWHYRVSAVNEAGTGPSSGVVVASTNRVPVFDPATVQRSVAENAVGGSNVGAPLVAFDADTGDTLQYWLWGGEDFFDIDRGTGQIRTKDGVAYDHETQPSYSFEVVATDRYFEQASVEVTINVTDTDEPPLTPAAPNVTAVDIAGSDKSSAAEPAATQQSGAPDLDSCTTAWSNTATLLAVSWTASTSTDRPPVSSYDLRWRPSSESSWNDGPQDCTSTTATIRGLAAGTTYEIQVRATNDEGDSNWSTSGTSTTATTGGI